MKRKSRCFLWISLCIAIIMIVTGCGNNNTVESMVISTSQYEKKKDIEAAESITTISESQSLYVSVYLIESPKGMEYTGTWYLDDELIKTETKSMQDDMCGSMLFELKADSVTKGTIRFDLKSHDDVLASKTVTVE